MPDFAVSRCFHSFAIIGFNSEPNGSFYLKNFHTALIRELAALTYFILRFAHISHQVRSVFECFYQSTQPSSEYLYPIWPCSFNIFYSFVYIFPLLLFKLFVLALISFKLRVILIIGLSLTRTLVWLMCL